ncbi:MAG: dihydroxyacetone kinase [Alkaliphilus sp.]|nr:MAG: dihydroxyacetone kinase [Alkaliphilus sp.]
MIVEFIDGSLFKEMILQGAHSLEKNKELINSLNVFPVPDGDTGTNMSLTMKAAVKEINACDSNSIEEVAKALANGSLMGARGNSGVILSQIFRGFAKGVKGKSKINTEEFAYAFTKGAETAYKAVMKPVEGTILTVARESAEQSLLIAKSEKDTIVFLQRVIKQAEITLKKTPDMLKVLKEAGVVDSGGKGLVYIYIGFLGALSGETFIKENEEIELATVTHTHEMIEDLEFSYCTEFLISASNINTDKFRDQIEELGDSLLVVGNENIVKVHIHTNNPGIALEKAIKLGHISDIKIDNMMLQQREQTKSNLKKRKMNQNKNYGIITVSMGEGLTRIFEDFAVDVIIEGGQTMNPSTEDFIKAIDTMDTDTIVILPNNSNIIMAANQAKVISSKNIIVIPTKSVPQGISALIAFNIDADARINEEAMLDALKNVKTAQVTYAIRDTTFNDIVIAKDDVIAMGNGEIKVAGKDLIEVSKKLLLELVSEEDEIITVYYGQDVAENDANKFVQELEKIFPNCDIELYDGGQPLYYYLFSIE